MGLRDVRDDIRFAMPTRRRDPVLPERDSHTLGRRVATLSEQLRVRQGPQSSALTFDSKERYRSPTQRPE
jgi:hypothetical protein